jgi:hypothetical protein
MNYLIIDSNGIVTNAIVANFSEEQRAAYASEIGAECVLHTGQAWIGWKRNNDGSFYDPNEIDGFTQV